MPARSRSRRTNRSRKSHRGGFAGLGGVIHQLSVPLTLFAANHHVGKKRHGKMHGGTSRKGTRRSKHSRKGTRRSKHSRKRTRRRAKGGMGFGDFGSKMLDHANKMRDKNPFSRENKFIKKMGEATEIVNKQSVPFPRGNKSPFQLKIKEVADLVARNAGPKDKDYAMVWKRDRRDDIKKVVEKFEEAMDKKKRLFPKSIEKNNDGTLKDTDKTLQDETKVTITGWLTANEHGMQWALN